MFTYEFDEAKSVLGKHLGLCRRTLGPDDSLTMNMGWMEAIAISKDAASLDELIEGKAKLEALIARATRVLGASHPTTKAMETMLDAANQRLENREFSPDFHPGPGPPEARRRRDA